MRRVWVKEVGGGGTYRAGAYLEHTDSPPLSLPRDERGHFPTFEACVCWDEVGGRVDRWTRPPVHGRLAAWLFFYFGLFGFFLSVLHLTVQMWESVDGGGGGTGTGTGTYHSVGKHANTEH